jgi:ATP-dependent exoDNAse (exonuclease V) beta subunit
MCAIRLAGCSPFDLIQHEPEELARDEAEGVRLTYVAATRARDLLVVPAVGDEEREGWIEPMNRAIYPPAENKRERMPAIGCPEFQSKDSVLIRPNGVLASSTTVAPGQHTFGASHAVVWWDPRDLKLKAEPPLGIRRSELIVKNVAPQIVEAGLADYKAWRHGNDAAVVSGSLPSIAAQTVTQWAKAGLPQQDLKLPPVEIIELPREPDRPSGLRFGALVHAVLGSVPLDGDADVIQHLTALQGRTLGATEEEVVGASEVVQTVLAQPILQRARQAAKASRCRRETPVVWRDGERLVEGVVDLAFEEEERWTLVDFKTDEEIGPGTSYQRQVGLYALAVEAACARPVSAFLLRI